MLEITSSKLEFELHLCQNEERIFLYMTEDWMQVTWKRLGTRMLILTHNSGPLWPPIHTSS